MRARLPVLHSVTEVRQRESAAGQAGGAEGAGAPEQGVLLLVILLVIDALPGFPAWTGRIWVPESLADVRQQ